MMRLRRSTPLAFLLACSTPSAPSEDPLASIALGPDDVVLVSLQETAQLTASGRTASGATITLANPTWRSSDPAAVRVSATGLVTALRDGTSRVSVTSGDVSAEVEIRVARVLDAFTIAPVELRFTASGQTGQLTASGRDAGGSLMPGLPVSWSSSVPAVATVSSSGYVTALTDGTTQVTATSGTHTASIDITVDGKAASVEIIGGQSPFKGIDGEFQLGVVARNSSGQVLPGANVAWESSNPTVAAISATGLVATFRSGTTLIKASTAGGSATWPLEIRTVYDVPVDPYLATPIANATWEIPVILLWYLPTRDGVNLDVRKAPDFWWLNPQTLTTMESSLLAITRHRKMLVEEGSRFRGYADPAAKPSLGYRVIKHLVIYDLPPPSHRRVSDILGSPRFLDYHTIFAEHGLSALIEARGVREVWVAISPFDAGFPSFDPTIHDEDDFRFDFESNMASPTTGDVSNSYGWQDDLPVLGHTYIVYNINYRRSQAEAVHNVGHQLERMFSHAAFLQDGHSQLFWRQFVGQNPSDQFITGRAGWTHMPPNTTGNYDYLNTTLVPSDIADWRPAGGATTPVNVNTWGGLTFNWPGGPPSGQREESQWYAYWMQNMPGAGNRIPHGNRWMTNWWAFVADWDAAIQSGLGLHGAGQAAITGDPNAPQALRGAARVGAGAPALPVYLNEPRRGP